MFFKVVLITVYFHIKDNLWFRAHISSNIIFPVENFLKKCEGYYMKFYMGSDMFHFHTFSFSKS